MNVAHERYSFLQEGLRQSWPDSRPEIGDNGYHPGIQMKSIQCGVLPLPLE